LKTLTLELLKQHARLFLEIQNDADVPELFGVTDGKAVGTYIEHTFQDYLEAQFEYERGSSASGIDFPRLNVDLKVTSARQPQSSSPFRSAKQKVYGLGYHLLVFVYQKTDDETQQVARLSFRHVIFIDKDYTADYQTTRGILNILEHDGNIDDIDAFLQERNLPLDDVGRRELATHILQHPPQQGYLTISNALQWRLQYGRAINLASDNEVMGLEYVFGVTDE